MSISVSLPTHPSEYRKSIASAVGVGLTYAATYYGTNHYVVLAIAIASVLGVYHVPNQSKSLILPLLQETVPVVTPLPKPAPVEPPTENVSAGTP